MRSDTADSIASNKFNFNSAKPSKFDKNVGNQIGMPSLEEKED